VILSRPHPKAFSLAPPAPSGGAWGDASPQTPAKRSSRESWGLDMGNGLWPPLPSVHHAYLRLLHPPRLAVRPATPTTARLAAPTTATTLTSTLSIIRRDERLAGVWGEASPQAPPEGAGGARRETQAPPEGTEGGIKT
jgi:hypothetical protein